MPKFRFLCSQSNVAAFKIGNSLYYADVFDSHNIKIYDSKINKLKIIVPEFWLPEVTRGEVTFQVLKYSSQAFEQGFEMASSRKWNNFSQRFCSSLDSKIRDPSTRSELISIYWVELYVYDTVKKMANLLIDNSEILKKDLKSSANVISRTIVRAAAENDDEFCRKLDSVYRMLETESKCKTVNHLSVLMNIDVTKTSHLFDNISTIIALR